MDFPLLLLYQGMCLFSISMIFSVLPSLESAMTAVPVTRRTSKEAMFLKPILLLNGKSDRSKQLAIYLHMMVTSPAKPLYFFLSLLIS
jgi:hypothetical protein